MQTRPSKLNMHTRKFNCEYRLLLLFIKSNELYSTITSDASILNLKSVLLETTSWITCDVQRLLFSLCDV